MIELNFKKIKNEKNSEETKNIKKYNHLGKEYKLFKNE